MKKQLVLAATMSLFVMNIAMASTMQSLTQQQLKSQLSDKTITTIPIVTMNGHLVSNSLTAYLSKDGKLTGQFSSKPENDPISDIGKWTVDSKGTFCATWDHWNKSKPICVVFYKVENSLIIINHVTKKLETIVLNENIKTGNQV